MNIYETVPAAKLKRSMFHWRKERNQTQDLGAIVPFFWREVLPGDVFKINQSNFIRVQPMVAAPFTPMRFYSEFWFFPTRALMQKMYPEIVDAWQTFIFGGPNGDGKNEAGQTPTLPIWVPNGNNVRLAGTTVVNGVQTHKTGNADAKGSLWDYFAQPVNQGYHDLDDDGVDANSQDFSAFCPLAFPKIAYNWLWNEFKRNENLESSVDLMSDDIQFCKWKHDRYTSALPFQQRGDPVALPLSGIGHVNNSEGLAMSAHVGLLPVGTAGDNNAIESQLRMTGHVGANDYTMATATEYLSGFPKGMYASSPAGQMTYFSLPPNAFGESLALDLSNVGTFTVSEMRLAFQTQKYLERAARGGVRYIEGLLSFFGVAPRNDVLNLPQFVGGMKQNIIVNEVLQTSETSSTPQGNISGRGISAGAENIGVLSAKEHGYLLGICWIKPDLYYSSQGVKKEHLRRSRYDFYWPQFAHLSEQPIQRCELFASPATMTPAQMGAGAAGLLGYTGIFNEYRSSENEICGEMRDTFSYWTLARKFTSAPELNSDFITCFPRKDIFAVQDEDEFLVDILTDIKAYRPIPVESNPGLIDHM